MKKILTFLTFFVFLLEGCATMNDFMAKVKESFTPQEESPAVSSPASPTSSVQTSSAPSLSAHKTRALEPAPYKEPTREQIRLVQTRLKKAGFDPGATDGILGPKTKLAIRKYQNSKGLSMDNGLLSQQTLKSLGVE